MGGKVIRIAHRDGQPLERSDEALLAACALGDRSALGSLFDRHYEPLRRFLVHFLSGDGADIDDLVQSTFELVRANAHRFRGRSAVKTWILGIGRNLARRHLRNRTRERKLSAALIRETPALPRRPDELMDEELDRARLDAALSKLSPKLREVFILVYIQGLSDREAAQVLGLREGAVWKRLHDGREKLRALLREVP